MDKEAIASVLTGMLDAFAADSRNAYAAIQGHPAIQAAAEAARKGEVEDFQHTLLYPLEELVDGLLSTALPGNHRAQFLMKQGDFVELHFKSIICQREGSACSADKSGWIIEVLARHLLTGRDIVVDRSDPKAFWVPKTVFGSQEDILEFYDALYRLYAGQPESYVKALAKVMAVPKADS